MKRLAIITTHPIQYNAPLFRRLQERGKIAIRVFYTWGQAASEQVYDPGFGKEIKWDLPLLDGYDHVFVKNIARNPGSHHFSGINNPTLQSQVNEWKPSHLLVYGWANRSHLKLIVSNSKKIPVLFRGDSHLLQPRSTVTNIFRRILLKWIYSHINSALFVGTLNKKYFLEMGIPEEKLVFAPHAVDNVSFSKGVIAGAKDIIALKNKLGIGPSDRVVVYAGKLDSNKNVSLLIKAFRNIKCRDLHLVVFGDGPAKDLLCAMAGDDLRIHFMPFQNQSMMPVVYGVSDIFVLPSRSETWGLAINEAMACGKAVIASSGCGAAPDLVQDGVNGFTFRNNDEADLEKSILSCLENNTKLVQMGDESLKLISQWSFDHICTAIEAVVQKRD